MANTIMLQNQHSGLITKGFYGFSWTTLFFGPFPALIRGDWTSALVLFGIPFILFFILPPLSLFVQIVACFIYNKVYTTRLFERGYRIMPDTPYEQVQEACSSVGVTPHAVISLEHIQNEVFKICDKLYSLSSPVSVDTVCLELGSSASFIRKYVEGYIAAWNASKSSTLATPLKAVDVPPSSPEMPHQNVDAPSRLDGVHTEVPPSDTKICPLCAEKIKAAARFCRYCRNTLPD